MEIEDVKPQDVNKEIIVNNEITKEQEVSIEEKQNKFLETTLGKVINTGIDVGIRALLPNVIEDEVIRNKKCYF